MLGYPGAGKTTAARAIHELTGAEHVSSDKTRLELFKEPTFSPEEHEKLYSSLDEQTERLLGAGKDVVYDANLNRRQHRQEKYDICKRTGAQPVLVWVRTPKELAKQRAVDPNRHLLVPHDETAEQMFERIASIIEEPSADEPYTALDGTNITPDYLKNTLGL